MIDIICGFTKLKDGNVFIDGKNIFENLEGWQSKIGYIPQNVVILNQSLRDNILFGSSSEKYVDHKIKKIIKQVKLDKFLKKLPNKLSQIIKQDGSNISGGEKQRIGIARALLHNPELILLDEATSGLDSFTEQKVLETIKNLKKTIIIVSHRINTLKFCDKVYSIDNSTTKLTNI
jgi:ABC-type multidrug transport system fused ATPase/permease subunit